METLSAAQSAYLLEAGIEQLHQESTAWLNEILFWKDELKFLEMLLRKISLGIKDGKDFKQLEHLQNKAIYYNGEVLDELKHLVNEHEKLLFDFLKNKKGSEQFYRRNHQTLTLKINSFYKQFKELKKELFVFIEGIF